VTSKAHKSFWVCFNSLPANVQQQPREKFRIWRRDPFHPSLHFKPLKRDVWSIRVNQNIRVLGLRNRDTIVWFWIGPHSEYDRLIG
jgi:hypothetical protein